MAVGREERVRQLEAVRRSGRELAAVFDEHSFTWYANGYTAVADAAETLLSGSFDQADLNELSSMAPARPDWLDTRWRFAFNYGAEPWMHDASSADDAFRRAIVELRVIPDAPEADA